MEEKKEQKIVVFVSFSQADKNLILTGIKLAGIFSKELCLAYRIRKKETTKREFFRQKLTEFILPLKKEISGLKTSVLLIGEKLRDVPDILADEYEAIILVADSAEYKKYASAVTESPVPFLFINSQSSLSAFKKLILPIDVRRENSDSALWCSWFGRFNKSEITAVAANEKSKDSLQLISRNVLLTKKLLQKSGVLHKIYKGKKSSFKNSYEALDFAISSDADLLVLLGSSVITPLDWLIGLPERKIIQNAGKMPVLLVNPRRDNYIMCD
jgi:hypothetical protein